MSITSVLYLKDGFCIATAGALDRYWKVMLQECSIVPLWKECLTLLYFSVVKFWDPRNLRVQLDQTCANHDSNDDKVSDYITVFIPSDFQVIFLQNLLSSSIIFFGRKNHYMAFLACLKIWMGCFFLCPVWTIGIAWYITTSFFHRA